MVIPHDVICYDTIRHNPPKEDFSKQAERDTQTKRLLWKDLDEMFP